MRYALAFLLLIIVACASRDDKSITATFTSEQLLDLPFDKLQSLDTAAAFALYRQHPVLHDWETSLSVLRETLSQEYLRSNYEKEREKNIRAFQENNSIYAYTLTLGKETIAGYLVRTSTSPEEWVSNGFILSFFATEIAGVKVEPVLVSKYVHLMFTIEFKMESITTLYSDHSLDFVERNQACSDSMEEDGSISCDSTRITTTYLIDNKNQISRKMDTARFQYNMR